MFKFIPSLIFLLVMLALPAAASAQVAGVDEYTESPPSVDGSNVGGDSGSDDADPTGSAAADVPDAGTAATGTTAEGSVTEAQAAEAGTPAGQLPATGLETLWLSLAGLVLAAAGYGIHRALGPATPGAGGLGSAPPIS